jgi:hypothetical protein
MATERLKRRAESDEEDYLAKIAEEECVQAFAAGARASICACCNLPPHEGSGNTSEAILSFLVHHCILKAIGAGNFAHGNQLMSSGWSCGCSVAQ